MTNNSSLLCRSKVFFDFTRDYQKRMARGHQKELARQRNEKNGAGGKPTTQKGTAGKTFFITHRSIILFQLHFSC